MERMMVKGVMERMISGQIERWRKWSKKRQRKR